MAENSNQEGGSTQAATRGIVGWTADKVLGAIIGTLITGSAVGVVWVGQDLTESMDRIMPTIAALERTQMHIQDALEDADIAKLRSDIRDVERDLGYAMQELAVLLSDHRDHASEIEGLSRAIAQDYFHLDEQLREKIEGSTDSIKTEIAEQAELARSTNEKLEESIAKLDKQVAALKTELAESRKQFSEMLAQLHNEGWAILQDDHPSSKNNAEESCGKAAPPASANTKAAGDAEASGDVKAGGDAGLDHRCEAAMRQWIRRASYLVRSLEIPTEMGVLKDTSVVKEDIRKALRDFEQAASDEDANGKRDAMMAALAVVQSVGDLAATGREY